MYIKQSRNIIFIFLAIILFSCHFENKENSHVKSFIITDKQLNKSFKGIENKVLESYPDTLKKLVIKEFRQKYGNNLHHIKMLVSYPATESEILSNDSIKKNTVYIDSLHYLVGVVVETKKGKGNKKEYWTLIYDNKYKKIWETKRNSARSN